MSYQVEHVPSDNHFGIRLEDEYGYLKYARKSGALSLDRIFVPPDRRGEGIAEELTRAAFRYCQKNGKTVIPVCPYIKDSFLPDHPEWQDIVSEDEGPGYGAEFLRL
jgi:predicted GNAT family acetyltransferase